MRITEAARRLGTSPRMLRYREALGLLPPTRERSGHRRFGDAELRAVAYALALEKRYDISPAELAFGLRVLAEPEVQARVRELGERIGRLSAPPARALDFEKEKALRLLRRQPPAPTTRAGSSPGWRPG
ncbi:MerR family transcriptional regulator [Thermomonospora umbrina]|uniref:MerR-like DNA binding protein n=1 Tax=Thermomonospora umbrina TaxID=111806 RepID=A0A3D9SS63_9ACTN|nr:MerR family transcriptional regulator [Thermomonospora umbrina]REE98447.1 MerR-like DNA binding protein [Thermomonospora umbrina]